MGEDVMMQVMSTTYIHKGFKFTIIHIIKKNKSWETVKRKEETGLRVTSKVHNHSYE